MLICLPLPWNLGFIKTITDLLSTNNFTSSTFASLTPLTSLLTTMFGLHPLVLWIQLHMIAPQLSVSINFMTQGNYWYKKPCRDCFFLVKSVQITIYIANDHFFVSILPIYNSRWIVPSKNLRIYFIVL